jgi:hypothetical protein
MGFFASLRMTDTNTAEFPSTRTKTINNPELTSGDSFSGPLLAVVK